MANRPIRRCEAPKQKSGGGRKPKNPFDLEEALEGYLASAEEKGLEECPLDFKAVARKVGCSHTHFSPKRIASAPPEYQPKWRELRERIEATAKEIRGRRMTAMERLQEEVATLREALERAGREKEQLWIWMIQIEAGLQSSGINTEMFIPEDLRYGRGQRRDVPAPD